MNKMYIWIKGHMKEKKIDEQDGYWIYKWKDILKNEKLVGWTWWIYEIMDIWMNEWMEIRMDGRIDALTQEQIESFTDGQTVLYFST